MILDPDILRRIDNMLGAAMDNTIDCSNNIPYHFSDAKRKQIADRYHRERQELDALKKIIEDMEK